MLEFSSDKLDRDSVTCKTGLDLQSSFGLLCTTVLIGWDPAATPPPPSHLGSYTRALLASQDRRHLFITPFFGKQGAGKCVADDQSIKSMYHAFDTHICSNGLQTYGNHSYIMIFLVGVLLFVASTDNIPRVTRFQQKIVMILFYILYCTKKKQSGK